MRGRFTATTGRLRPPEDGIVPSTRASGWVVDRWLDRLGELERTHGARLSQGRNIARNGRVRGLWLSPGLASAQVVDDQEYNVSIRFRTFGDDDWKRTLDALLGDLRHVAALIEGELNVELVQQLEEAGVHLLPRLDEMDGDCDCDDYMLPCAHMAAVHQILAEALDGQPFLLFTLRGRPRAQLLKELRRSWGDSENRKPEPIEEDAPLDVPWFDAPQPLAGGDFEYEPAKTLGAGLRALGPPPGDVDLLRSLGPLYEAGSKAAHDLAMSDLTDDAGAEERMRVFKRSVQRPAQVRTESTSTHLTERLVDALAAVECARSKDLAKQVGAPIEEVRRELLDLETLGIVYRTGQTRGTRWWLG